MASENADFRVLRRSNRNSLSKGSFVEPTRREPIKRHRKGLEKERRENQAPAAAVNGSKEVEDGTEDEEPPSKTSRLETERRVSGSGDDTEMGDDEAVEDQEKDEDQEMDTEEDSSQDTHEQKKHQGGLPTINKTGGYGDVNFFPRGVLGETLPPRHVGNEVKRDKQSTTGPQKGKTIPPVATHDVTVPKKIFIEQYRRKMEDKVAAPGGPNNHYRGMHLPPDITTRQRQNNIPTQKQTSLHKLPGTKKPAGIKRSAHSSRGFMWYFWRLLFLMLLSCFAALLVYKITPVLKRTADGGEHPSRVIQPEKFVDHLSLLEAQFPSQRPEVWKRSKIHLEKHLRTAQPTEPVSLIFTAGLRAEKTLLCLAQGLASAFSSALNASVLHIDGPSKASQSSDQVKFDIDRQFRAAFEGDKPAAIIHRFEELPPGSTLIFYRYCDHENSAYKRAFLLFTVLLPQDEVRSEQSLREVEEMVQDYVKERLVGSRNQTAFNMMDVDKYGGLWSRISHLILPVVSEKEVEERGC